MGDEALVAAYEQTDYRVRLPCGGYASIRVGAALPDPLHVLSGNETWAVVTAWHPRSHPAPRHLNRMAQRGLLAQLRALPETRLIRAAIGVGCGRWREPSLWVVGPRERALRQLCIQHDQHAWVMGDGQTPSRLCWTDIEPLA